MNITFKVLLTVFLVLFVITLLAALIQGIRIKNQSSKKWGLSALVMAILAVGSFWGVSASSNHQSTNQATTSQSSSSQSSMSNSSSSNSSSVTSESSSKLTSSEQASAKASSESQRKADHSEQQFEERDRKHRDMENRRQEQMLAKKGTDKKGYAKQISRVPSQSSHVVEKVTYNGTKTVAKVSSDLTMGNRRENQHNAFTIWSGLKRIAFLHHVKTNIIILDHNGKEIANTNNNRFNYLE
ncbi:hypothetical protein [Nicoliella lavandulae]|uniref:Uncharacterized protein n=1 Tax=Nicoliella lavandulae TaxID=3082954 RepID=A0ABU8SKK8_9LACO